MTDRLANPLSVAVGTESRLVVTISEMPLKGHFLALPKDAGNAYQTH